tara:strand:- start:813 stop:1241 length:429 start_codon:yes stop_codon:yes gene_type:complete
MIDHDDMFIPILSTAVEYTLPGQTDTIYRASTGRIDGVCVEFKFDGDEDDRWTYVNDHTFDHFVGALIWHYEMSAQVAWTTKDYYAAAAVCTAAGYVLTESDLVKICGISTQWNEGPYTLEKCLRNFRNYNKKADTLCEGAD